MGVAVDEGVEDAAGVAVIAAAVGCCAIEAALSTLSALRLAALAEEERLNSASTLEGPGCS